MEDSNVIIFIDKVKKLIELGNKPKAITDIELLELELNRAISKKKGKLFTLITVPPPTDTEKANPIFLREFELANKINEIITFLNGRFSPQ